VGRSAAGAAAACHRRLVASTSAGPGTLGRWCRPARHAVPAPTGPPRVTPASRLASPGRPVAAPAPVGRPFRRIASGVCADGPRPADRNWRTTTPVD